MPPIKVRIAALSGTVYEFNVHRDSVAGDLKHAVHLTSGIPRDKLKLATDKGIVVASSCSILILSLPHWYLLADISPIPKFT